MKEPRASNRGMLVALHSPNPQVVRESGENIRPREVQALFVPKPNAAIGIVIVIVVVVLVWDRLAVSSIEAEAVGGEG